MRWASDKVLNPRNNKPFNCDYNQRGQPVLVSIYSVMTSWPATLTANGCTMSHSLAVLQDLCISAHVVAFERAWCVQNSMP